MKTPSRSHPQFASDSAKWRAVEQKEPQADGQFWFAVKTTGIFCRPSCPSRTPLRENVRFFSTPAAAEAAGFRPCKRCSPTGPTLTELHAAAVTKACRLIDAAERTPALSDLARHAGISLHHFHRIFKAHTGLTPRQYAAAQRQKRLRVELDGAPSVTSAIYAAGYSSSSRFYSEAPQTLGMSPTAFRAGGSGESLRFAVAPCSLGYVLVAASGQGICVVTLGDRVQPLIDDLRARFPQADLHEGDASFDSTVAEVVAHVEAPGSSLALPLDIRGTAFQQRVWKALQAIPSGHTATYREIAERIGQPDAVRAVAGACAANHIAIAIPCHRVVRTDGSLSGYRWGVERKRALLDREAQR